jgi:hypothetical protein
MSFKLCLRVLIGIFLLCAVCLGEENAPTVRPVRIPISTSSTPFQETVRTPSLDYLLDAPLKVKVLDLSNAGLNEISGKIMFFTNLTSLDLRDNNLTELPPEIGDLTKLTTLDLRMNHLTRLPQEVSNLTGLQYIFLTGNNFSGKELSQVRKLLPFTRIIHIPLSTYLRKEKPRTPSSDLRRTIDSLEALCRQSQPQACEILGSIYEELNDLEQATITYDEGCRQSAQDTSKAALTCCMEAAEFYGSFLKDKVTARLIYRYVCVMAKHFAGTACDRTD